eukprot:scaffold4.g4634.t1
MRYWQQATAEPSGPDAQAAAGNASSAAACGSKAGAPPPASDCPAPLNSKWLVYSDPELEAAYRLHAVAQRGQLAGWLIGTMRALALGRADCAALTSAYVLVPTAALYALRWQCPRWWRRHWHAANLLLQAPNGAWLVQWHHGPLLDPGAFGAIPRAAKLLICAAYSVTIPPVLSHQLFAWAFPACTLLLALSLARVPFPPPAAAALVAAYATALGMIYCREVAHRRQFLALIPPPPAAARAKAARASPDPLSVLDFLIPAICLVCWSCL